MSFIQRLLPEPLSDSYVLGKNSMINGFVVADFGKSQVVVILKEPGSNNWVCRMGWIRQTVGGVGSVSR